MLASGSSMHGESQLRASPRGERHNGSERRFGLLCEVRGNSAHVRLFTAVIPIYQRSGSKSGLSINQYECPFSWYTHPCVATPPILWFVR
jgi:hypothetical protein